MYFLGNSIHPGIMKKEIKKNPAMSAKLTKDRKNNFILCKNKKEMCVTELT